MRLCFLSSCSNSGVNSLKSGGGTNKKSNSFRGVGLTTLGDEDGDQQALDIVMSPYEQLEAESEALVSKLLDMVCTMLKTNKNVNSAAYQEAKT